MKTAAEISRCSLASRVASALTLGWSDTRGGRDSLRDGAVGLARSILRCRSRPLNISTLGPTLVVAPHPDDETLGCGGTIALLGLAQSAASLLVITDGSASHRGHEKVSPQKMASIRRDELFSAANTLGLSQSRIYFAGARDGTLSSLGATEARAVEQSIAEVIAKVGPSSILIPLRRDRSTDHDATFKLVSHSLSRVPIKARVLEYPIWSWRDPLALVTPALLAKETWTVDIMAVHHRKRRAIEAYRSQVEPVPPDSHPILSSAFLGNFLESEEFFFER